LINPESLSFDIKTVEAATYPIVVPTFDPSPKTNDEKILLFAAN